MLWNLFIFATRQSNPFPVERELGLFGNPPGIDHISLAVAQMAASSVRFRGVGSYTTSNAAQSAALVMKTGHPVVQVSVYDAVDHTYTIVEVPAAAGGMMRVLAPVRLLTWLVRVTDLRP